VPRPLAVSHWAASWVSVSCVAVVLLELAPPSLPGKAPLTDPVPATPGMVKVPCPDALVPPNTDETAVFVLLGLNF
jgi:hypothetical protein